jgi:hypothetical protein
MGAAACRRGDELRFDRQTRTGGDESNPHCAVLLSVDGVASFLSRPEHLALQAAHFLKSRNPNSVVKLKDMQGEEIVIAFPSRTNFPRPS